MSLDDVMLGEGTIPRTVYEIAFEVCAEVARACMQHPYSIRLPDNEFTPDGKTAEARKTFERIAKLSCERAFAEGRLTHAHVLEEEVAEALAADTVENRRKELIQVAAMCLKQIWDIDTRGK